MKSPVFIFLTFVLLTVCACCCSRENTDAVITFNVERLEIDSAGGIDGSVTVSSNCDWSASCSDNWVAVISKTGSSGETPLEVRIDENSDVEPRFSRIVFKCGSAQVATLTISQSGMDFISADKNIIETDCQGGTLTLQVKTNTEYELVIPSDVDWIHDVTSKTLVQDDRTLLVDENPALRVRDAVLNLTSKGVVRTSVRIRQNGCEGNFFLFISYSGDNMVLPTFYPDGVSGLVSWGDGHKDDVCPGLSHSYEMEGEYPVEVEAFDVEGIHFDDVCGIEKITVVQ